MCPPSIGCCLSGAVDRSHECGQQVRRIGVPRPVTGSQPVVAGYPVTGVGGSEVSVLLPVVTWKKSDA